VTIDRTRRKLLGAALPHVPFDGWTLKAILAGARDAGLTPAQAANAFPGGPAEMIEMMSRDADDAMLEAAEKENLAALKVRERISRLVRLRLGPYARDREAVRRAVAVLALPQNGPLGLRLLYRTVDAIWYAAGDTATDHNFYTKRALLAGVYAATLLHWLDDSSESQARTWDFLDRRIGDVMRVPQALGRLGQIGRRLPNPALFFRARRRRPLHSGH